MHVVNTFFWTATVITTVVVLQGVTLNSVHASETKTKQHVVEIRNLEFSPKELVVAPGDTITWVNYDLVPHTVTADDESWDSGLVKANDQWQTVVQKDMQQNYFCRYHPTMTAQLRIVGK